MTRMASPATVAVAADYADAMMTARRAKNWLFLLLLVVLLAQLTLFFLVRYRVLKWEDSVSVTSPVAATTQDATGTETRVTQPARRVATTDQLLRYVIPVTDFLGITLSIVLVVVLLLFVIIMLVGRLIGVSHLTSAFIWCVLLTVLLFPWQAFLIADDRPATPSLAGEVERLGDDVAAPTQPAFKVPGVLYTYQELRQDVYFANEPLTQAILKWARFVGFPVLALLILLAVQVKSSRGLKFALGESDVQVDIKTPTQ